MKHIETLLIRYFHYLESKGTTYNFIVGLIWTAAIGTFDACAPIEAKHSFFYILPVAFVTWFSGIRLGAIISLLCTVFWSGSNLSESVLVSAWNVVSTLVFFLAVAALLNKTRLLWENEKNLSRTDPLTGAVNLRAFFELVEYEMLRSQREKLPFSLAYLDLDNFKQINDTYG
ncbi:MAG TPA: diguanylate cyclase, partial [Geobacteraceae bacterium]|nr:diguanylate cyclase [Geobacteraceae bacterium]